MRREDVYKTPRPHEVDLPRAGDIAEILRGHCRANAEAGMLVQVMGKPHLAFAQCADCASEIKEFLVEVHCDDPHWQKTPGPWFYPIGWLKRIDPRDLVGYERIRNYQALRPTPEQLIAANK